MKFSTKTLAACIAFTAVLGLSGTTAASAATATWYSGPGCHNVVRSETGATLSQSRTGIQAEGGSTAGLSTLTVWYGTATTAQQASKVTISDERSRTYLPGKFRLDWNGAINGECTGDSYGRALNAGSPGARQVSSGFATIASAVVDGWQLAAVEETSGVTVSAESNGMTYSAVFSPQQIAAGAAEILITDTRSGESHLVTYEPDVEEPLRVTATTKQAG